MNAAARKQPENWRIAETRKSITRRERLLKQGVYGDQKEAIERELVELRESLPRLIEKWGVPV